MQERDQEFIKNNIRRHLQVHPGSADTAEGIAAYWIDEFSPSGEAISVSMVLQALESLRDAGELESIKVASHTVWRARRINSL